MSNYYQHVPAVPERKPVMPSDDTLTCIICQKPITVNQPYVRLPYGSRYDGEPVCGCCCRDHFDPVIDDVKREAGYCV